MSLADAVDEMQRWKAAFHEIVPKPGHAEKSLLRDRLARFASDVLSLPEAERATLDQAALDDLITEIERI